MPKKPQAVKRFTLEAGRRNGAAAGLQEFCLTVYLNALNCLSKYSWTDIDRLSIHGRVANPAPPGTIQPMYQPPQFKSADRDIAARLMREHPFASLISNDDDGVPFITHLPLHLEDRAGTFFLLGHCARANAHWLYLQQRPTAVVTFLGPHAYQSPKIYPDLARVPSWTYLAVHCTVSATLIEDPVATERILQQLIADHEPSYAQQWRALGDEFARQMMAGIVAFELEVVDLQCKLKLNQHRPESHVALKAGYRQGNEHERELAVWMDRLGLGGSEQAKEQSQ